MSGLSCDRTWSPLRPVRVSGRNDWPAHSFQLPIVEIPGANSTRLRADLPVGPTNTHDSESERPLHTGGRSGARGPHADGPVGAPDVVSGWIWKLVHASRGTGRADPDHLRCHHHRPG